jgi:hypothetical protein
MGNEGSVPAILAEESEIILAERRAFWSKEGDFEARLAAVEPLQFYMACLDFLRKEYEGDFPKDSPSISLFKNFLRGEINALREADHWPVHLPEIKDIL